MDLEYNLTEFVPKGTIDDNPALVKITAWC